MLQAERHQDGGIDALVMAEPYFLYPTADSKSLVVWDMERQHTLGQLDGHDDEIIQVDANGGLAASVGYQGRYPMTVRVWNLETMHCNATLPEESFGTFINSVCCMEGKVLLGQRDGVVKLWDVAASAPVALADLAGHTSEVHDIKAAGRSMILSGSSDKTARLWDLRTSSCVRTMEGHSKSLCSVDMDGYCRTAVSGSWGATVKLWDLGSGRCIATYESHTFMTRDVVMHESGSSFPSSGIRDGIVNAWAVGNTRATMRADMASSCVPDTNFNRLFASRDLSTIALCSVSSSQLGLSVWRYQ